MRIVLQRVKDASVTVDGRVVGAIPFGLLALVGMAADDTPAVMRAMAAKLLNLRIFDDPDGKMNLSVADAGGSILAVSQFTLYADCRKGRRPSYSKAAPAEQAARQFEEFVGILRESQLPVATGQFQAMMDVAFTNLGPVTILLDSAELGISEST